MAVILEGISIVIKKSIIDEKFKGGIDSLKNEFKENLKTDNKIIVISFDSCVKAAIFLDRIINIGISWYSSSNSDKAEDCVVVDLLNFGYPGYRNLKNLSISNNDYYADDSEWLEYKYLESKTSQNQKLVFCFLNESKLKEEENLERYKKLVTKEKFLSKKNEVIDLLKENDNEFDVFKNRETNEIFKLRKLNNRIWWFLRHSWPCSRCGKPGQYYVDPWGAPVIDTLCNKHFWMYPFEFPRILFGYLTPIIFVGILLSIAIPACNNTNKKIQNSNEIIKNELSTNKTGLLKNLWEPEEKLISTIPVNTKNKSAVAKYKDGDYLGAMKDFREALILDPNNYILNYNIGLAYFKLKDNQIAIKYFDKSIENNPDNFLAFYSRGYIKVRYLNNSLGALADLDNAIKIYPNSAAALGVRGYIKDTLGNLRGACSDWEKSNKLGGETKSIINAKC